MSATTNAVTAPLVVSTRNPRYFTASSGDRAGRAVYLTGSHIWNNLHDGMGGGPEGPADPERFDYDGYLRFLSRRGHNFIRLWRWEQFRSQAAGGTFHLNMSPQPWARSGPGLASDGKPRFDLERLDPGVLDRLRERVAQACDVGIYVGVMLFDGWALHLSPPPDHIEGHPFHAANNVNGISVSSIDDLQVLPLDPRIRAIQATYVRAVVDTVHDLPNVLWEVANESSGDGSVTQELAHALGMSEPPTWGDSTRWQYWVIDTVKHHEADRGYDPHPIGMTMQFPVADQTRVNEPLLHSDADWISPGYDDEIFAAGGHPMAPDSPPSRWFADPPAADGRKVVITDTDHYAPGGGDALWAWKSFLRGHHPILMDFGLIGGPEPADEPDAVGGPEPVGEPDAVGGPEPTDGPDSADEADPVGGSEPAGEPAGEPDAVGGPEPTDGPDSADEADPVGGPEPVGEPAGEPDPEGDVPPFDVYEPARWAMGDTRRYAERVDLVEMEPLGDLSSTDYALAHPGEEYLVLEPNGDGRAFTVTLAAGRYSAEWFNVATRDAVVADAVMADADARVELAAPWPTDPAVLYLVRAADADSEAPSGRR